MDSPPKCTRYNCNHLRACILGTKCKLAGHTTRYYRKVRKVKKGGKVCYECGCPDHFKDRCPMLNRGSISTKRRNKATYTSSYDQLLNNSYKCCRLKVAQIFDRVANIGRDPRLRLLLGVKS
ncbi:hypothetical protein OSB04_010821 [Centaurea solstitialis]|uniref:CCHC-type domain-containing protein n=1 Tax=Centaurea solstitialis TaxID=347529 RepID=A0AA38WCC0_9ASTR|nr:hypothetical protein OSB04_010821 [Centaurea solstitialis]